MRRMLNPSWKLGGIIAGLVIFVLEVLLLILARFVMHDEGISWFWTANNVIINFVVLLLASLIFGLLLSIGFSIFANSIILEKRNAMPPLIIGALFGAGIWFVGALPTTILAYVVLRELVMTTLIAVLQVLTSFVGCVLGCMLIARLYHEPPTPRTMVEPEADGNVEEMDLGGTKDGLAPQTHGEQSEKKENDFGRAVVVEEGTPLAEESVAPTEEETPDDTWRFVVDADPSAKDKTESPDEIEAAGVVAEASETETPETNVPLEEQASLTALSPEEKEEAPEKEKKTESEEAMIPLPVKGVHLKISAGTKPSFGRKKKKESSIFPSSYLFKRNQAMKRKVRKAKTKPGFLRYKILKRNKA